MKYLVYINGHFVPAEQAKVSVFDSAYLYGQGLFETLVAVDGRILFLKEHLARLKKGARLLKIPFPKIDFQKTLQKLLRINKLQNAYLRINLSAEEDVGARGSQSRDIHLSIFAKPADPYPRRLYQKGARLIIIQSVVNDCVPIAQIKTTNYLVKMLARNEIKKRRADEGILLNAKGFVCECAGSNIFMIKGKRLITPPVSDGLMPGVTRQQVITVAPKQGLKVIEKSFKPSSLFKADEVFITSTIKGVMPVATIEEQVINRNPLRAGRGTFSEAFQDEISAL
jgi:branched-chain amino acid aminotransferase